MENDDCPENGASEIWMGAELATPAVYPLYSHYCLAREQGFSPPKSSYQHYHYTQVLGSSSLTDSEWTGDAVFDSAYPFAFQRAIFALLRPHFLF
jgi:hypothetical protein